MKNHTVGQSVGPIVVAAFLACVSSAWAAPILAYGNDFDGGTSVLPGVSASLGGFGGASSVYGYAGYGQPGNQFSGNYWSNQGTAGQATTLTLTGLPAHAKIDLDFLLAIIESWDGTTGSGTYDPDYFTVVVDGSPIFSETFDNFYFPDQSYNPAPGALIVWAQYSLVGFDSWPESAYDMSFESAFHNIPHSASSLTVSWYADGGGWQAGLDEYWAIENLKVSVHPVPEAGLGTGAGIALAAVLMLFQGRRSNSW